MNKLVGMLAFLLILYLALLASDEGARSLQNHFNLGKRIGLYGIISLGAGLLIISGGIDLSIGAVVGLSATVMAMLLTEPQKLSDFIAWATALGDSTPRWLEIPSSVWSFPPIAMVLVLGLGASIGLIHGLLVTRLKVQAFVVTLCGLFIYRGAARWVSSDHVKGLGNQFAELKDALAKNKDVWGLLSPIKRLFESADADPGAASLGIPVSLIVFLILGILATIFLHFSVYGRYLYAIGSNERAARYSGIATDRYKVLAYLLCSLLASFFGILFLMEENSVQPSESGNFYELYAIAGAVLGGCSLRGGEGNVVGILIGTTILWILPNFTKMWGIGSELEFTVIGGALLLGAILDESLRAGHHKLVGKVVLKVLKGVRGAGRAN